LFINKKGLVTNAKNIKADRPKILRLTHFSCMKDIKANSFLALTNINADMFEVENKAENVTNIKADWEVFFTC
jgi:hypothetical protein